MKAREFLDQLNPQSAVFDENISYDFTENQLILFAELYHKHKSKNIIIWRCVDGITDSLGNTDFTNGMIYEQVKADKYTMMLIDNYGNESEVSDLKGSFKEI
jgi:hypothetical protein